ncbi:MAG: hypothetical protein IJR47_00725 [Clostridia bacterium]|nr:hypothetical protein [Clostridia bacterium]
MIKVICGRKGSGKTKRIVELANKTAETAKGSVAFLDDDNKFMYGLRHEIRFINYNDFGIRNSNVLEGVIIGLLAGNYDIEAIFIDGLLRVVPEKATDLGNFFNELENVTKKAGATVYFTVSMDQDELPEFIKPYVI